MNAATDENTISPTRGDDRDRGPAEVVFDTAEVCVEADDVTHEVVIPYDATPRFV